MRLFPSEFPGDNVDVFIFVPNSLCAIRYNDPAQLSGQPCNGDSGGGIFTKDTSGEFCLSGVLSWGTPSACTLFTVFESMRFNREWIEQFGNFFNIPATTWLNEP